jgi:galactokinase
MALDDDLALGHERARKRRLEAELEAAYPSPGDPRRSTIAFYRAPGAVNLIGDHTDYNDGLVLSTSVGPDTWLAVRSRKDGVVRLANPRSGERSEFRVDDLAAAASGTAGAGPAGPPRAGSGGRVAGIAWALRQAGLPVHGFDGVLDPAPSPGPWAAGGTGNAAALELAAAHALIARERLVSGPALAALAQLAERDYLGSEGSIVDRFVSASGRPGRAVLLDCRSLESRYVVMPEGLSIVICTPELPTWPAGAADPAAPDVAPSAGPALAPAGPDPAATLAERKAECGRAVALLAEEVPTVASLRDLDSSTLRKHRRLLPETLARRAEHVVGENERVVGVVAAMDRVTALDRPDAVYELGRLFAASHHSLQALYEVGSPALDVLVELAVRVPGVVAARMSGTASATGGYTVNLVRDEAVPALELALEDEFPRRTGLRALVRVAQSMDGAGPV